MKRILWISKMLLVVISLLAGCSGKQVTTDWVATVDAKGTSAVVSVDVPGKQLGKDYHPHLSLDGGPEVMMYNKAYSFQTLKPGAHHVRVIIADPKHNPIAGMEKTLPFETK